MEKYLVILIVLVLAYYIHRYCVQTEVEKFMKIKEGFADAQTIDGIDDSNAINTLAKIAKDLQEGGGLKVMGNLEVGGSFNLLPRGVIVAWNGQATQIPKGWFLCNGQNGTPDLRNRFIVGSGSTYSTGNTGGADTVTLTVNQMPSHTHKLSTNNFDVPADDITIHGRSFTGADGQDRTIRRRDVETNLPKVLVSTEGKGEAHENRPPYYALAWIMKA